MVDETSRVIGTATLISREEDSEVQLIYTLENNVQITLDRRRLTLTGDIAGSDIIRYPNIFKKEMVESWKDRMTR